jgi:hypothetical protein
MKPFNLKEALAGKPVVTRDGRPVKIAGYNHEAESHNKILGWVDRTFISWYESGIYDECIDNTHKNDLFMAPTERKEWIVRVDHGGKIFNSVHGPYDCFDMAERFSKIVDCESVSIHEITITE